MAVKTFTTGEVLTAADTNTYLNNGGLVYIKSQTIGSGVSSVAVSSAFSADFDNYRILVNGGVGSTAVQLGLQLGSSTTLYYWSLAWISYGTSTVSGGSASSSTSFANVGYMDTNKLVLICDVINPFATKFTQIAANSWFYSGGASVGYGGEHQSATSHTAFTLIAGAGTMTGGTITVYGYRKA